MLCVFWTASIQPENQENVSLGDERERENLLFTVGKPSASAMLSFKN